VTDTIDATDVTDATATGAWFDTDTETLCETRVELDDETLTVTLPADSRRGVRVLVEGVATLPQTVRVRRGETVTELSSSAVELGHEARDATRETAVSVTITPDNDQSGGAGD